MITTEILNQSESQFTLSIKVNDSEFFGRALQFSILPGKTIEEHINIIVADVESRIPEVVEMPVPEVISPDEGA